MAHEICKCKNLLFSVAYLDINSLMGEGVGSWIWLRMKRYFSNGPRGKIQSLLRNLKFFKYRRGVDTDGDNSDRIYLYDMRI